MDQIRAAIKEGSELTVRILNYTKAGKAFWNMFTLAPMRDQDGHARFFVGVQVRSAAVRWGGMGAGVSRRRAGEGELAGGPVPRRVHNTWET